MAKKGHTAEAIIGKLREAEVLSSQGRTIGEICKALGITDQTYYRWRKEYGGMRTEQAQRLKELEKENQRLRKLVSDLALDKAMLQDALAVRTVPMNTWAPGRTTTKCRSRAQCVWRVGAACVPGDSDPALQSALSQKSWGDGTAFDAPRGRVGDAVWTVWLSAHHGVAAARRLGGES